LFFNDCLFLCMIYNCINHSFKYYYNNIK
jgi:hypothetical protein